MKGTNIVQNPFVFGKIVKKEHFLNRDSECRDLMVDIQNHTNVVLYAPRRFGKSSLVLNTFYELKKEDKDFSGLYIDFYSINSKEKFLTILTKEYAKNSGLTLQNLLKKIQTILKGIKPSISLDTDGNPKMEFNIQPDQSPELFEEIIQLPKKLADEGRLTAVFLDEFQEITRLNGNDFQKELRTYIQHHDNVSYIFSGSKQHLFDSIFNDSRNPLYNIGKTMSLSIIPIEYFSPFFVDNFKKVHSGFTEAHCESVYKITYGIPLYVQMLSHESFNLALLNPTADPDELIDLAVEKIIQNKSEHFLQTYENLSLAAKRTLEMVIALDGKDLYRSGHLDRWSIPQATLSKSLTKLMELGILTRESGMYLFQDVFYKKWLENFVDNNSLIS